MKEDATEVIIRIEKGDNEYVLNVKFKGDEALVKRMLTEALNSGHPDLRKGLRSILPDFSVNFKAN